MAVHLERTLTKDEILTLYLNKIFFGHRAYGVAAAAAIYYGKPLAELTVAESRDAGRDPQGAVLRQPGDRPRAGTGPPRPRAGAHGGAGVHRRGDLPRRAGAAGPGEPAPAAGRAGRRLRRPRWPGRRCWSASARTPTGAATGSRRRSTRGFSDWPSRRSGRPCSTTTGATATAARRRSGAPIDGADTAALDALLRAAGRAARSQAGDGARRRQATGGGLSRRRRAGGAGARPGALGAALPRARTAGDPRRAGSTRCCTPGIWSACGRTRRATGSFRSGPRCPARCWRSPRGTGPSGRWSGAITSGRASSTGPPTRAASPAPPSSPSSTPRRWSAAGRRRAGCSTSPSRCGSARATSGSPPTTTAGAWARSGCGWR